MSVRRYLILGLALLAVAGAWIGARAIQHSATAPRTGDVSAQSATAGERVTLQFFRNPAPVAPLTLRTLDGKTVASADWRGKVTIVNFWATWCGPCRAEIPDLVALQKKYSAQLQVIGISQDEAPPDVVQRFASEQHVNYPIVMSTPELERAFPGIYALPTSYLIDRDGRIVQKHVGMLNAETTEGETRLLAGLSVNATVEYVEDETKALIKNAAQATKIPGVDLDSLSPAAKAAALTQMNHDTCTCGCALTLAACRINDPTCSISLPLAQKIAANAHP